MTKNPILNAFSGILYISSVALLFVYAPTILPDPDTEFTILFPIGFLSLFVFSAAIMGYLFLYQPIRMFLEGEKEGAVKLFLHTMIAFAAVTFVFVFGGIYLFPALF